MQLILAAKVLTHYNTNFPRTSRTSSNFFGTVPIIFRNWRKIRTVFAIWKSDSFTSILIASSLCWCSGSWSRRGSWFLQFSRRGTAAATSRSVHCKYVIRFSIKSHGEFCWKVCKQRLYVVAKRDIVVAVEEFNSK